MPHIDNDIKLDFKDVLLRPKRSTLKSRSEVELEREATFRNSGNTYRGVPIMASNMDTVGTFPMAVALHKHGLFTCIHKHYAVDAWVDFAAKHPEVLGSVAISAGSGPGDLEKLSIIAKAVPNVKYICLDVANGYTEHFVQFVRSARALFPGHTIIAGNVVTGEMVEELLLSGADLVKFVRSARALFPGHTIIAGNVVTGEMVEELLLSGADLVKVGIGPGSVCTTRQKTGVGYPQLSAVLECGDAAHGLKGHIISDGGCTCAGDVAKAFGAGADFVMMGGLLAGHDESEGDVITVAVTRTLLASQDTGADGKQYKQFYGMSSSTAMHKHHGTVADYRASEGKTVNVPYRGPVDNTILDLLGGIRSACTYTGAIKLKELSKRATFIRVTQQLNPVFGGAEHNPASFERRKRPAPDS